LSSKRVDLRSKLATSVASAGKDWSAPIAERLKALLEPYLRDGETMPDVELLQQLLGRLVADKGSRLVAGDDVLDRNILEARLLRGKRDEAAKALRKLLGSARFYFDQVSGRGAGAKLGIGHGLSWMEPSQLARVAEGIALHLDAAQPDERSKLGALPDPVLLAPAIRGQAARLEGLLDQLRPYVSGTNLARGEQMRGLEETEHAVRRCASVLAEIYKLCGFHHLAKVVRPVFRRKPRRKKGKTAPAAVTPEAGLLDGLDLSAISIAEDLQPATAARTQSLAKGRRVLVRRGSS
jgi:hypothetical protein